MQAPCMRGSGMGSHAPTEHGRILCCHSRPEPTGLRTGRILVPLT
jgi:hypothetical protein